MTNLEHLKAQHDRAKQNGASEKAVLGLAFKIALIEKVQAVQLQEQKKMEAYVNSVQSKQV